VYAVGRYPFQKELALKLGVEHVFTSAGKKLIEEIAQFHNIELYYPDNGLPWAIDGFDGIIDNIASASTLEIGMRILISQGKLVFPGVNTPARMESTVHYFKELEVIGSNAFAIEKFNELKKQGFEFFMVFKSGNSQFKGLVTHHLDLDYSEAFRITSKIIQCGVKVVFSFI
jgi:threonine dehydrogenase-like Zn-dependent dehydrogenase